MKNDESDRELRRLVRVPRLLKAQIFGHHHCRGRMEEKLTGITKAGKRSLYKRLGEVRSKGDKDGATNVPTNRKPRSHNAKQGRKKQSQAEHTPIWPKEVAESTPKEGDFEGGLTLLVQGLIGAAGGCSPAELPLFALLVGCFPAPAQHIVCVCMRACVRLCVWGGGYINTLYIHNISVIKCKGEQSSVSSNPTKQKFNSKPSPMEIDRQVLKRSLKNTACRRRTYQEQLLVQTAPLLQLNSPESLNISRTLASRASPELNPQRREKAHVVRAKPAPPTAHAT